MSESFVTIDARSMIPSRAIAWFAWTVWNSGKMEASRQLFLPIKVFRYIGDDRRFRRNPRCAILRWPARTNQRRREINRTKPSVQILPPAVVRGLHDKRMKSNRHNLASNGNPIGNPHRRHPNQTYQFDKAWRHAEEIMEGIVAER